MAWMQRRKSFMPREGEIQAALGVLSWWDEIDESEQWQRGIYYTLCVCYASVSIVALVQLARIQLRVPEYGWTTQKLFHLMNFIVNGLRALLFALYKSVFLIRPQVITISLLSGMASFYHNIFVTYETDESPFASMKLVLEMVLMDLPGLLFFSTFTLLVLFWAEIYHQARSLPIDKLRPAYFASNGFMYFTQVCVWIFIRLSRSPVSVKVAKLFFSVMSFSVALGFLIYGGRLFFMLRRFPIESRGRQKKLYEVGCVTGICCTCFLIRCFVLALATVDKDADVDVLDHPILNLIYYMLVEIVPSALVLFILRKLPPRRVSDHYQPIS